jgi:DNA-binding MurR/RpiR family transcriptional regulator
MPGSKRAQSSRRVSRARPAAGRPVRAPEFDGLIRARYASLSPAHRRVADYLISDGRRAALTPAGDIAKALGISEATVVRFAQALGLAGYPELREHLRERFLTYATSLDRLAATSAEKPREERTVFASVLANDAEAIMRTLAQIPTQAFDDVVRRILRARRVYVVGLRGSAGVALILGMGLRIFLPETRVLSINVGDTAEELLALERDDVVIVISYLRYSGQTLEILRYAHDVGAGSVAITDSPASPIARLADVALVTASTDPRVMASYASAASLASALVEAVAAGKGGKAQRALRTVEGLWQRFRVHAIEEQ